MEKDDVVSIFWLNLLMPSEAFSIYLGWAEIQGDPGLAKDKSLRRVSR